MSTASSRLEAAHGHVKFSHAMVDPPDVHAMGSTGVSYSAPRLSVRAPLEHAHACSVRFAMVSDSRIRFGHAPQTLSVVALQGQS